MKVIIQEAWLEDIKKMLTADEQEAMGRRHCDGGNMI